MNYRRGDNCGGLEKALRDDTHSLATQMRTFSVITDVSLDFDKMRRSLMDRFREGLTDFSLSYLLGLSGVIWKELIYYEISELRKLLNRPDDYIVKRRLAVVTDVSLSFYQGSLNTLLLNCSHKQSEVFQLLVAKFYMAIGDLKRYRLEFEADVVDKSCLNTDYVKACYFAPSSDFIYNKLAILYDATGDTFETFFYYIKGCLLVQKSQTCQSSLVQKATKWTNTFRDHMHGRICLKQDVVREMGSALLICSWIKLLDRKLDVEFFTLVLESWKEFYDQQYSYLRRSIPSRIDATYRTDNYWNVHKIVVLMIFAAHNLMKNRESDSKEFKNLLQLLILHIDNLTDYTLSALSLICYELFDKFHKKTNLEEDTGLVTFKIGFLDFKRNENSNFKLVQTDDDSLSAEDSFLNDENFSLDEKVLGYMYIETITLIFDWAVASEDVLKRAAMYFDRNMPAVLSNFCGKLTSMMSSMGFQVTSDENVERVFPEDFFVIGHTLFSRLVLCSELQSVPFKPEGVDKMLQRVGYLCKLVSSESLFKEDGIKGIDTINLRQNGDIPKVNKGKKRNKKSARKDYFNNVSEIDKQIQFGSAMAQRKNDFDRSRKNDSDVAEKKQVVYVITEDVFRGPLRNVRMALERKRSCIVPNNALDILDSRNDKNSLARATVQLITKKVTSKYPYLHFSTCETSLEMDEDDIPFSMRPIKNMIFQALECVKQKLYSKVCVILTNQLLKNLNSEPMSRYFIDNIKKSHGIEFNCVENIK